MRLIVALCLTALLAGCASPPGATPPADTCFGFSRPTFEDVEGFSGENAFGHVLLLSCDYDRSPPEPRARVPGTPGRVAAADHIARTLEEAGWRVERTTFTGRDYDALPKGSAEGYTRFECSAADRERMLGLSFENVAGDKGEGRDVTIFMAHYDSKRFANEDPVPANQTKPVIGANDGASGVGVLLEAARMYGRSDPGTHLRFLLVDGEDGFEDCHPLAGSIHYAQNHPPPTDSQLPVGAERIVRVINLDMVGDPNARFCYHALPQGRTQEREAWKAAAARAGVSAYSTAGACGEVVDDHTAFADAGYPALDVIDNARPGFPPYWHTSHDTPDKLSPQRLGETGRVLAEFVRGLSAP